jgi:hypothetical protein
MAFLAARFAVVPPGALLVAGFRFVDLLDWDLDALLVLLVAMRPDIRIARLGATLWRSDKTQPPLTRNSDCRATSSAHRLS